MIITSVLEAVCPRASAIIRNQAVLSGIRIFANAPTASLKELLWASFKSDEAAPRWLRCVPEHPPPHALEPFLSTKPECVLDSHFSDGCSNRLWHILLCKEPASFGQRRQVHLTVARCDDDVDWRPSIADRGRKHQSVHASRHVDVRKDEADVWRFIQDEDGFACIACFMHLETTSSSMMSIRTSGSSSTTVKSSEPVATPQLSTRSFSCCVNSSHVRFAALRRRT